jgi:23S rRNA pseudouridine1911/1915/1917 synthase
MKKNEIKNSSFCHDIQVKDSIRAELDYTILGRSDNYYLLEIVLKTGRHHQIRAQLSTVGSPIKGDLKYGANRSNPKGGISLHARKIEFIHPVKKETVVIMAKPPKDEILWKSFDSL